MHPERIYMDAMSVMEPLALNIPDLAKAAGVSVRHVYSMMKRGEGPPVVKLGRRRVVRREAAEAWLRSMEKAA